jgi:P-type conjugative transfer protein TrbJ
MRLRKFITTLFVALLATPRTPAMTGGLGIPAQEWTQLLNHAQLVLQLAKQAQILDENMKQFQQLRLSGMVFNSLQWVNFAQQIAALSHNIQQGQGLAYTMGHLDLAFRQAYPGYLQSGVAFDPQYRKWNRTNLDTIQGVLGSLNVHADQMQTEAQQIAVIRNFASSAVGQTQAIQAGVLMADKQVEQLAALRQLMAAQTQVLAVSEGRRINNEQVQQQIQGKGFGDAHFVATN